MKISARNQLKGVVAAVEVGAVNAIVKINVGGQVVSADITKGAVEELGLSEGTNALAVIKASNVMFAAGPEPIQGVSARNQLVGIVASVEEGAVNGHVRIALPDGNMIHGSITNAAISDLGLAVGGDAVAIIKSTDVMVGIE